MQLDNILGDLIDFKSYSIEDGIKVKIHCNLYLVPVEDMSKVICERLFPYTKIVSIRRTLLM